MQCQCSTNSCYTALLWGRLYMYFSCSDLKLVESSDMEPMGIEGQMELYVPPKIISMIKPGNTCRRLR